MYYIFSLMLLLNPFIIRRMDSGYIFGIIIISYSIFLALFSSSLGADFENYEYFVAAGGVTDYLLNSELLFTSLLEALANLGLNARYISVINGVLFIAVILVAPKLIRGLVSNVVISIFLTVSIFNGLRLGFAVSSVLLSFMMFLRLRTRYGQLWLLPLSGMTHTSLLFPVFTYLIFSRNFFNWKAMLLVVLAILYFVGSGHEFFDQSLIKVGSYFEYGGDNNILGGFALFLGGALMIYSFRHDFTVVHLLLFGGLMVTFFLISLFSYFGIRMLGLIPLAFYLLIISKFVNAGDVSFIKTPRISASLKASFLIFSIVNVKNILFGDAAFYSFSN